jgi:uncharacterized protein (DUF2062 family)
MSIRNGFSAAAVMHCGRRITAAAAGQLQGLFSCGLTPRKIALTLCLGGAIGTMPLLWGTTVLCMVLAYLFKLNQAALQSVNYLLYPLQLALLLPFYTLGAWLFPWGPPLPPRLISSLLDNPGTLSLEIIGWITVKSLAAWLVTALPLALLAYLILRLSPIVNKARATT